MRYIDVHAHLESNRYENDLDKVIERCKKNDCLVITAGVNPSTNRTALELKKKYPETIKVSFGLYPIDALAKEIEQEGSDFLREIEYFDVDEEINWMRENKSKCVAIGEIGLDYNYEEIRNNPDLQEKQKIVFRKILDFAKEIDKPVVIHSRKAEEDAIKILEEKMMKKVVMHCFSAKKSLVKRCIDNGWYLSIPAKITRLEHFKMVVEMTPIEQLLTETDSPLLSPVAGERNEPSNVIITIKEIAKIKNISEEEVRLKILDNAKRLFNLNF